MSASNFEELSWHVGHDVEVVTYQRGGHVYNIAIECNDCGTVLMDFDNPVLIGINSIEPLALIFLPFARISHL